MKARTASRLAWSLWGLILAILAGDAGLSLMNSSFQRGEDFLFLAVGVVMVLGYATAGALVGARHPGNAIGWLYMLVAFGLVTGILSEEYPIYALRTAPGSLPAPEWVAWLGWGLPIALAALPMVFLLFPTGRVPSPRWRPLAWLIVAAAVVSVFGLMVDPRPLDPAPGISVDNPTGIEALRGTAGIIIAVGGIPLAASALGAVAALFLRFRRARGDERQQIKWLAYVALIAGLLFVGTLLSGFLAGADETSAITDTLFISTALVIAVGIPVATGIGVLRHRLFDVDVVINKTLVYGALAAFVTLVYVGIVVGIGALVGSRGNLFLSILATAVIALAFHPVRQWARRFANRLVYGKRATPYELLSQFSQRMGGGYSADEVLPEMARTLGEGTGAARTEVWLRVGRELRREAMWPSSDGEEPVALPMSGGALPAIPEASRAFPVEHRGELLGALTISISRGETVTPATEKLVGDVASQAGLVLRNVRLIEELRASRQRLVAAQDEERRRLERNIHDGAQQQLVALSVKLRLAENLARKDADKAVELMAQVRAETQQALEDLRDLARGIYPPLLADKGLSAALESQARKAVLPVTVERDGVGRYPQEAEAAVYFCVLEALQNVSKYAGASTAVVRLSEENGHLVFAVTDDGRGFDTATTPRGSGLQNMADRLDALGGRFEIVSGPNEGTTVTGRIPVQRVAAAQASSRRSGSNSDLGM